MGDSENLNEMPDINLLAPVPLKRTVRDGYFIDATTNEIPSETTATQELDEMTEICLQKSNKRTRGRLTGKSQEEKWLQRYDELKAYKEYNGDTYVPVSHPTLGRWAATQRTNYQLLINGKPNAKINMIRVGLLKDIGFCFDTYDARWEENFRDLRLYRQKYGHCNVPRSFIGSSNINGKLGSWVRRQRNNYKLYVERKSSSLNQEKVSKLESLGFQWSCSGVQASNEKKITSNYSDNE